MGSARKADLPPRRAARVSSAEHRRHGALVARQPPRAHAVQAVDHPAPHGHQHVAARHPLQRDPVPGTEEIRPGALAAATAGQRRRRRVEAEAEDVGEIPRFLL